MQLSSRSSNGVVLDESRRPAAWPGSGGGGQGQAVTLDEQFDSLLLQMKPYVMSVSQPLHRQRCAAWIKKLCQFNQGSTAEKKSRNVHAQLLLHVMKRGQLEQAPPPFCGPPPADHAPLPILTPQQLASAAAAAATPSSRVDTRSVTASAATPAWVESELDVTQHSHLAADPGDMRRRPFSCDAQPSRVTRTSSPNPPAPRLPDRSESCSSRWWSGGDAPREGQQSALEVVAAAKRQSLERLHERQVEQLRAAHHSQLEEERARAEAEQQRQLQSQAERHEQQVRQLEEQWRAKADHLERTSAQLADKLAGLEREAEAVRKGKDRQLAELKALAQSNLESLQSEYEGRVSDLQAQFDQHRQQLEEGHAASLNQLLADTDTRLRHMQREHEERQGATGQLVQELEGRVGALTQELEGAQEQNRCLELRNADLQHECHTLNEAFGELKRRLQAFELKYQHTIHSLREDKHQAVSAVENRGEELKKSHAEKLEEMMGQICELEDKMVQSRQQLQDAQLSAEHKVKEAERAAQAELARHQQQHQSQLKQLQLDYQLDTGDLKAKLARTEHALQCKQEELEKVCEMHKREMSSSEASFDQFKQHVHRTHAQVYDELREERERLQTQLQQATALLHEAEQRHTDALQHAADSHQRHVARLEADQRKALEDASQNLQKQLQLARHQHQTSLDQLRSDLEQQSRKQEEGYRVELSRLTEELAEAERATAAAGHKLEASEANRKQQLLQLGRTIQQMKEDHVREKEKLAAKARAAAETDRAALNEAAAKREEQQRAQWEEERCQLKQQWEKRLQEEEARTASLEAEIERWREQALRDQQDHSSMVSELKQQHSQRCSSLLGQLDQAKAQAKAREKALQHTEASLNHKINSLVVSQNERVKLMVPSSVRDQLEATITSLRSQVQSLQQTVLLLQSSANNKRSSQHSGAEPPTAHTPLNDSPQTRPCHE